MNAGGSKVTWQDLLNILTLKGADSGVLKNVRDAAENTVKFQMSYSANKHYLEEWLAEQNKFGTKSASESEKLRLAGNKVYQKGKDLEALNIYNLSVAKAPYNTNQFALALSNRSAVLGRLVYYKEAVQDIDLALLHGDSNIPRSKLLIRKAVQLSKLGLHKDALNIIKSLFPDEDQIHNHKNLDLKQAYFDSLKKSENTPNSEFSEQKQIIPELKGGENKSFQCASGHISLSCTKEKGRYVVAKEDLKMSDVIFVEKPFALVVLPDQYQHHCHHCCKDLLAFLPCAECARALFCSESCRDTAWSEYHRWECRGLEICHSVGIAHLGLRVALLADSRERYPQVCDLVTHVDDMKAEDLYQYSITAALLTLFLEQNTSYFACNPSISVKSMGGRILQHIAQLICNGHAITKIDTPPEKGSSKTMKEAQVRIATAIYPSASMMNHSCDHNILNSFINDLLIVRACKPIKSGEEIFNCYGPNHKTMSRDERQKLLKSQYFFTCDCTKCSKSSECDFQQFSALLCSYCSGPVMENQVSCSDCRRPQPLLELVNLALMAQEAFHRGKHLMKEGNRGKALTCFQESVNISSKCLYKHNSDLRKYKDSLARLYVELGRYNEAVVLVDDCMTTIEKQFGCSSLELSRELIKMYDLLELELARQMGLGLQSSEGYRNLLQKLKRVGKQLKDLTQGNIDSGYLSKFPGMADALNSVA